MNTWRFLPDVGGLEAAADLIAGGLCELDHTVTVTTRTVGAHGANRHKPYRVVERPGAGEFLRLLRRSDIFVHNNISGYAAWPLMFVPRPWVVSHHVLFPKRGEPGGRRAQVKGFLLRYANNISVSEAISRTLRVPSVVIENPYDDRVFKVLPFVERSHDVIFIGRLVPDKGVDVMLRALAILASQGKRPVTTIVGDGSARAELEAITTRFGLSGNVTFVGTKTGGALAELLNQHKIMVVPSTCEEAFGIVALEGIACGCMVVAARSGGLPEAVGPCGKIFPKNDHAALAEDLALLLGRPQLMASYRVQAGEHLRRHSTRAVAERYLKVFRRVLSDRVEKAEL